MQKITVTCTTGRRFKKFIQAMGSFLANCKDLDLVDKIIVSDDGSSDRDFLKMKAYFKDVEFYRSPKPGQAASLNFLFSKVKTEWFFHTEDDWLYIKPAHFIDRLFSIACQDKRFKNVILTRWEPLNQGLCKVTSDGVGYVIHKFDPTAEANTQEATDSGWLGWSLNPGLQHKKTITSIGRLIDESPATTRLWDREAARIYYKKGYLRASIYDKEDYIKHIGYPSLYGIVRAECRENNNCKRYPDCEGCNGFSSNYDKSRRYWRGRARRAKQKLRA